MHALSPEQKTATPAQIFDQADEEIRMWVHAGILEAQDEAARECFTDEGMASIVPVDPNMEDADTEEQRARLYLQEDLNQAIADGFSVATEESITLDTEEAGYTDDDLEIIPDTDDWDVLADDNIIVNPFDEKVKEESKEDVISKERAKEFEDINKIIEITSSKPMPSGTTAAELVIDPAKKMTDSTSSWDEIKSTGGPSTAEEDKMKSSGISTVSMVGDAKVIPMEVDEAKQGGQATRKGEPNVSILNLKLPLLLKPAEDKTAIVDLTSKAMEADKPVGRPAEKKMPKPEKQKAPGIKAMPRPKAPCPCLNAETDRALKKLEEATEGKEGAVWLDPDDMASRIPREYCGQ